MRMMSRFTLLIYCTLYTFERHCRIIFFLSPKYSIQSNHTTRTLFKIIHVNRTVARYRNDIAGSFSFAGNVETFAVSRNAMRQNCTMF